MKRVRRRQSSRCCRKKTISIVVPAKLVCVHFLFFFFFFIFCTGCLSWKPRYWKGYLQRMNRRQRDSDKSYKPHSKPTGRETYLLRKTEQRTDYSDDDCIYLPSDSEQTDNSARYYPDVGTPRGGQTKRLQ